jgi:hypothetical protein
MGARDTTLLLGAEPRYFGMPDVPDSFYTSRDATPISVSQRGGLDLTVGTLKRWLIVANLSPILLLFVAMMSLFLPLLSAVRPLYYRCSARANTGKTIKFQLVG